ncbi:SusC/RagA family TonB-linked outer membrane protein [Flavobacterium flavipallidum]|uniref:SusC/RagA family TonB-linked outer membrane protein n=1 Tax=Flavobacterium flavipallidum TaxID=3139140 RepID=A0ABU9HQJ3_9FLAO
MAFFIPHNFKRQIILALVFLSVFSAYSQNATISLNFNNSPVSTIIKEIEKQSQYRIIYNARKINVEQKKSINISKASLQEVLNKLFKGSDISFYIQKKQVLLIAKSNQEEQKVNQTEVERFIHGKVVDVKTKSPLPGATIRVKGTGMGAITDINGEFVYRLTGNNIEDTELEVTYIGMQTQLIKVGNKSEFRIALDESTDTLDQIVITSSYGTKKLKEEVVGSISTLRSKDIAVDQASESIDKMVEGQIAGVLIENTSGVGNPVKINIRGQGTLQSLTNSRVGTSTQPLIIIDGVVMAERLPIDSELFNGNSNFSENLSNPLNQITPETIESFTVLKDAAAVGIYGADGANGVILITTKKGKKGKAKFSFSNQLGVSSAINQIKYLSGAQYNELRNDYLKNTSSTDIVPYNGVNTNWFDLLNKDGVYTKYNFNVSGGTDKFTYRSSINYQNIDEPQMGNTTKQLTAGINLGFNHKKLDVSLSLNPSYIQKDAPNVYYSFAFLPTIAPYNEDGSYTKTGVTGVFGGNPLAGIAQNKNLTDTYGILGSLNLGYQWSKSVRLSTLFGIDYSDKEQDRYYSGENESGQNNGTFLLDEVKYPNWGRRIINQRNTNKWNWQGQLLFNKQFAKKHNVDGVLGFELSEEKGKFDYASATGFVNPNKVNAVADAIQDDDPDTPDDDSRDNQTYKSEISNSARVSLFSQINYSYDKRYYLLANLRRDQSSVFGSDNNVALNSGIGLAWALNNEAFLRNQDWIDLLKLKASYGSTGNSRIGSYRSKGIYTVSQNGYNGSNNANASDAPNENLGWEKNTKFNFGVDFNVFNRIQMSLEYYYDNKTDLISSRDIPSETGYSSVQLNAATMYNRGFEFSTTINWFRKEKFKWSSSINISTVDNKVTDLVGLGSDYSASSLALAQKIGYSTTTLWGVKWVGVDPATGRDLIKRGDEIFDAATYKRTFTNADWEPIGDTQPKAFGGFRNALTINNRLTLTLIGSFQWGGDKLVSDQIISKYSTLSNRNMSVNAYDYWRNPGDIVTQPAPSNVTLIENMSKYLYDATFIKISNVNLSYNVPVQHTFLDNLNVFFDISNVAYWYKQKSPKGMNGIREFSYTYPQARTISLGINTKF